MTRSIVAIGIVAGAAGGYGLGRVAASHLGNVQLPGVLPVLGAAAVLSGATVVASLMPAARASGAWTPHRRSHGTRKQTTRWDVKGPI